jgi:hypothetical protein
MEYRDMPKPADLVESPTRIWLTLYGERKENAPMAEAEGKTFQSHGDKKIVN